jgi:hypothetical protein
MPACPFCNATLSAKDLERGKAATCPRCGSLVGDVLLVQPGAPASGKMHTPAAAPLPPASGKMHTPTAAPLPPASGKMRPPAAAPAPPAPRLFQEKIIPRTPRVEEPPEEEGEDQQAPEESLIYRLRHLDGGTVTALFCGSMGLLAAALPDVGFPALEFVTKPLGAVGLLAGMAAWALPGLRGKTHVGFPAAATVLCLGVLLFAGSWPRPAPPPPPPLVAYPYRQGGMVASQPVAETDWVDASTYAVQKNALRVQVVSAKVGSVELKAKAVKRYSPDKLLAIRVRVSYLGVGAPLTYERWADLSRSPSKHPPTLTDNLMHPYTQKAFDPAWSVVGRWEKNSLAVGHDFTEVLVYPVPAGTIEYLRLQLPASALGGEGEFRFQIPRGMIENL